MSFCFMSSSIEALDGGAAISSWTGSGDVDDALTLIGLTNVMTAYVTIMATIPA